MKSNSGYISSFQSMTQWKAKTMKSVCYLVMVLALAPEIKCSLVSLRNYKIEITQIHNFYRCLERSSNMRLMVSSKPTIVISHRNIQYNLNGSNTDGSFTMNDSNSFIFSPYKILPIAQENKYLGIFFLFYHGIVC